MERYRGAVCIPIIVGEKEDSFLVHRDRLFSTSSWFQTTLNSGLKETALQQISLPKDDPEVVEIFLQWLYGGSSALCEKTFMQLARLYEFANRLFISELKNSIIRTLYKLRKQDQILPTALIEYVYEHVPEKSPFRKLLIAWFTWHKKSAKTLTEDVLSTNLQFAAELVLAMIEAENGALDIFTQAPEEHYELLK